MIKKTLLAALGALAFGCLSQAAHAEYPEKPIKLIIPYKAGGGSDSLARVIQTTIEKYKLMPQPIVVVNATGAGGIVGARRVKDAEPDGYTFLQMHNELFALQATGRLGFDVREAYEPVAQTTQACLYLATPASSPYKTFDEMASYAKENPGKLKLAEIVGGITHFSAVSIMQARGIDLGIVQTGGTSARFASMEGGHTQLAFLSPGWIKKGGDELRGLLWMGETAPEIAGDMPTAKSLGIDAVGCLNRRFWAPKGTPTNRVAYFADVLRKVMDTPELKEFHDKNLSDIHVRTGDELAQDIDRELATLQAGAETVKQSM